MAGGVAGAAAPQPKPSIVYQYSVIHRESADAPAAKFKAAQANDRAAIQRKGAVTASRRAHLEHIPVIGFTSTLSLDGECAAAEGEIAGGGVGVADGQAGAAVVRDRKRAGTHGERAAAAAHLAELQHDECVGIGRVVVEN